jgi:glycosyltransferase involved in cell wall biosynthesis
MSTVCVVMIVKNEEHVIQRSLGSLWPFVDSWCIVDTGSTDATKAKIQEIVDANPKPGMLFDRPWKNFGHNRSEALALAREHVKSDWHFMMDADDIFKGKGRIPLTPGFRSYRIRIIFGGCETYRTHFFLAALPWIYEGSTHEYPTLAGGLSQGVAPILPTDVFTIDGRTEGARSKNPFKYRDDALALEADLAADPNNGRALFYAAQSWRDANEIPRAMELYKQHVDGNGWSEERYMSCVNVIKRDPSVDEWFKYAWKAMDIQPRRREAATALLGRLRAQNIWRREALALGAFVDTYADKAPNDNFLFLEPDSYSWRFADEYSLNACFLGVADVAYKYMHQAAKCAPPEQTGRLQANLFHTSSKLFAGPFLTLAGCFAVADVVCVVPSSAQWTRCAELITKWVQHAGLKLTTSPEAATVLVYVGLNGTLLHGTGLRYIVAYTPGSEQFRAQLAGASHVWCADVADHLRVADDVVLGKVRIVPFMVGPYYVPRMSCSVSNKWDVVVFGASARTEAFAVQVKALPLSWNMLAVSNVSEVELGNVLLGTRAVVVLAESQFPVRVSMEDLAFLAHFGHAPVIIEDVIIAPFGKQIVEACLGAAVFVPNASIIDKITQVLQVPAQGTCTPPPVPKFLEKLLKWDGKCLWTDML